MDITSDATSDTASDATTTFERIGGAPAVSSVVDELYKRATADPELAGYFHATDLAVQRGKLADMIGEAMGGPAAPWLLGLREAHVGRGVTHRHFSLLAAHLIDILIERGVDDDETNTIMQWFAAGRAAVVEDDTV